MVVLFTAAAPASPDTPSPGGGSPRCRASPPGAARWPRSSTPPLRAAAPAGPSPAPPRCPCAPASTAARTPRGPWRATPPAPSRRPPGRWGRRRAAAGARATSAWRPRLELDFALHRERPQGGEQRYALDEGRGDDHGGLNAGAVLRLARHAFHRLAADPSNADARAQHGEARGEAGADQSEALAGGIRRRGVLQQSEQIQRHVTLPA